MRATLSPPVTRNRLARHVLGLCALGAFGCQKAAPAALPPPEVTVLAVAPSTVPFSLEYVGQAEASRRVNVRSQLNGVIIAQPYVEGTDVKRGDVLFRLDTTIYAATYRSAIATLANAVATFDNAQRNLARLKPLLAAHAVAQKDVDDAQTALEQAQANVADKRAAAAAAKKDYDDTNVRAEIPGRAGRALLVLGARVAGPSDLLTTVEQVDPIYVNFSPSDQDVLRWRRDIANKRLIVPSGALDVRVHLSDGSVFPHTGKVNFVDLALQPVTGTLQLRATFPNPEHTLLPGQFVRVSTLGLKRTNVILVPQRAVQQGLGRQYVYLLTSGDSVVARDVVATAWTGSQWMIEGGLATGDRVIVDGVQKVQPGALARAVPYVPEKDSTLRLGGDTAITAAPSAAPPIRPTK